MGNTAYNFTLTLLFVLALAAPEIARSSDDAILENNGFETGFQEILVDAGPFGVLLEPCPVRLLFQTEEAGVYFLQNSNIATVPVYMELLTMEGQQLTNNEVQGKLLYGVKIKLQAKTLYTLHVHAASVKEMGKTAQIFIAPPQIPPTAPPPAASNAAQEQNITPFADEAKGMALVEADPTPENRRKLAALRAARSRDLLVYAEEHADSAAFDLALRYAQSAGQLDPTATEIKLLEATLYSRAQDLPMAAQLAQGLLLEILTTKPEHVPARQLLAELYFNQADFASAIDQFEYLVHNKPQLNNRMLAMLVNSYAASGEVTRGRLFFRKQLQQQGESVKLHLAAALLAHHANDQAAAMGQLERVIRSPRAEKSYILYAQQLKTIWTGDESK